MALTREVGSEQLVTVTVVLTADQPWAPVASTNEERRGAVIYVDPASAGPAYLATRESHASGKRNGVPFFPNANPPGFELGTTGAVWVYALAYPATVYWIEELGQNPDHG